MVNFFNRPLVYVVLVFASGVWWGVEHTAHARAFAIAGTILAAVAVAAYVPAFGLGKEDKHRSGSRLWPYLFWIGAVASMGVLGMYLGAEAMNPTLPENHISKWISPAKSAGLSRVTLEGTIAQPPRSYPDRAYIYLDAERIYENGHYLPVTGLVRITVMRNWYRLKYGDRIRMQLVLKDSKNFSNPGGFDYEKYLAAQGIFARGSVKNGDAIVVLKEFPPPAPGIRERIEIKRDHISRWITLLGGRSNASKIMRAIVVGDRWAVPRDINGTFARAGVAHLLAVSGLHHGLVASIVFFLMLGLFARSEKIMLSIDIRRWAAVATIVPVIMYALLAGWRIPTVRAAIMVIAYMLSITLGRERDLYSTIALAAFIILVAFPSSITEAGFIFSFSAVIAIAFILPAIRMIMGKEDFEEEDMESRWPRIKYWGVSLFLMTVGIQMFTGPLAVLYFHRLSPVSPFANLLLIPIFGYLVLPLGLAGVMFHFMWAPAGDLVMQVGLWSLEWAMKLVELLAAVPLANRLLPSPTTLEILLVMGIFISGMTALNRKAAYRKPAAITAAVLSLVLVCDVGLWYLSRGGGNRLEVTYLDVGEGNSAVARFPDGKVMVVDTGIRFSGFDSGERIVGPYLLSERLTRIDVIAISHPHYDHAGGLRWLLENFKVGEIWMADVEYPEPFAGAITEPAKNNNTPIRRLAREEGTFKFGGAEVDVWWPPAGTVVKDVNDSSLVFRVRFGETSFVFPGDVEEGVHLEMFAGERDYGSTVLLAPHHGAAGSVTGFLMDKLRPTWAVISARHSAFRRFPNPKSVKILKKGGAKVLRTDDYGAIRFSSDGNGVNVKAWDGKRFRRIEP